MRLLAIILAALPIATLAEGVVLFDKATGQIQERWIEVVTPLEVPQVQSYVVTNHVVVTNEGVVSTNIIEIPSQRETVVMIPFTNTVLAFGKLHPIQTTWDGNTILADQVLSGVDWALYDLARFRQVKHDPPATINDLVQVEPFGIAEIQQAAQAEAVSKAQISAGAESNLLAVAAQFGVTNRPLDWLMLAQVGQQISATNLMVGMSLRLQVMEQLQFYTLNGGDPRQVGKHKTK